MITSILFICTGNTCRSVMAEYLFKKKYRKMLKFRKVKVSSAGIATVQFAQLPQLTRTILQKEGVYMPSLHKPKQFNKELLEEYDLLLTMEKAQKEKILTLFPELKEKNKLFMLTEYVGEDPPYDILDPHGGSKEAYETCAANINKAIKKLIDKLNKINE